MSVPMFEPTLLATYIAACFIFTLVPGPGVTLVLANSLSQNTRAGLLVVLGVQISMFSMILVVAFGLDAVVRWVGEAFFWIKLAGAAYLLWIGWKMLTASGDMHLGAERPGRSAFHYIVQGMLVNWGNPKTLLFLGAFLPQFVQQNQPVFPQIMVLGAIVMVVATITDGGYAILAGSMRERLTAARLRTVSRISGAILICGGVWLALVRRG